MPTSSLTLDFYCPLTTHFPNMYWDSPPVSVVSASVWALSKMCDDDLMTLTELDTVRFLCLGHGERQMTNVMLWQSGICLHYTQSHILPEPNLTLMNLLKSGTNENFTAHRCIFMNFKLPEFNHIGFWDFIPQKEVFVLTTCDVRVMNTEWAAWLPGRGWYYQQVNCCNWDLIRGLMFN